MRHEGLWITTTALAFGHEMPVVHAVAQGLPGADAASDRGQIAVRVAPPLTCCAVNLVRQAVGEVLRTSDQPYIREHIGPVFHAAAAANPPDALAMDVTTGFGLPRPHRHPALTISARLDGVIAALELADAYLLTQPLRTGPTTALISAGEPSWPEDSERWNGPMPIGDGTGALLLSDRPGRLRLTTTAVHADKTLDALRREGGEPEQIAKQLTSALAAVVDNVLHEAGHRHTDVRFLVAPFGDDRPELTVGRALLSNLDRPGTTSHLKMGRKLGRLGAADLIAGLHRLARPRSVVRPCDLILMLADGGHDGNVRAALLEVD